MEMEHDMMINIYIFLEYLSTKKKCVYKAVV